MSSRFNTEPNTGLRGMFASEYIEAPKYPERVPPPAEEPAAIAAAPVAESGSAAVDPASDVTPLMSIYPRTAAEEPNHNVRATQQASGNRVVDAARVPLYSYAQLERMSGHGPRVGLKLAASNLRDALQESLGPDVAPPLNIHAQHDELIRWVLNAQLTLARASGLEVTLDNFGIPNDFDRNPLGHLNK